MGEADWRATWPIDAAPADPGQPWKARRVPSISDAITAELTSSPVVERLVIYAARALIRALPSYIPNRVDFY
ncbi:MAG: hypothetical protein NVS2B6_07950 [Thermoleophilaceae bacterium]